MTSRRSDCASRAPPTAASVSWRDGGVGTKRVALVTLRWRKRTTPTTPSAAKRTSPWIHWPVVRPLVSRARTVMPAAVHSSRSLFAIERAGTSAASREVVASPMRRGSASVATIRLSPSIVSARTPPPAMSAESDE